MIEINGDCVMDIPVNIVKDPTWISSVRLFKRADCEYLSNFIHLSPLFLASQSTLLIDYLIGV